MKINLLLSLLTLMSICIYSQTNIHSRVDSLILDQKFVEAEQLAKSALEKYPLNTEALCALACVYRNMAYDEIVGINTTKFVRDGESGEFELNENNFNEIFKPLPVFIDSFFEKAEEIYYQILQIDPQYHNAWMNLLNSYEEMDNYEKYFASLNSYLDNNKNLEDTRYILLDLAHKLHEKGTMEEAGQVYEVILSAYPDYADAISDLGAVYFIQAEFEKAKLHFEKSLRINPDDTLIIDNLVKANIITGDYDTAFIYAKMLVSKTVSYFDLFYAGELATLNGSKDAKPILEDFIATRAKQTGLPAEEDFWQFAASTLMEHPIDSTAIEEILYEFYINDYHFDVIPICEILLKQDMANTFALPFLASTYEKLNYTKKALQMLEKIKALNENEQIMPNNAMIFNFGRNYFIDEQYQKAIECMEQVSDQEYQIYKNYLIGECYYYLKNYPKSIEYHKKNSTLDDEENMYYINLSLRRLKEFDENN
nr:hypothetical protein [Bacteroidota bacterium]